MAKRGDGPSILLGALAGYAAALVLGIVATVLLSLHAGQASASAGLKLLASAGALGAYLGYWITVQRRKARGVHGPLDDWPTFATSGTFLLIALIVLAGALAFALLIKLVLDALM
jgi:hypothetical protein